MSDSPGTTRDFLSERIDLDGIPVTLIDTAGLTDGAEGVEAAGVRRSRARIEEADLVIVLCACDREPDVESVDLARGKNGAAMLLASKCDLGASPSNGLRSQRDPSHYSDGLLAAEGAAWDKLGARAIRVSAVTGEGIDRLRSEIIRALLRAPALACEEILVSDARHHDALSRCRDRLRAAREALAAGASEEVALVDLYAALGHLGEITGVVRLEEIHERIFTTFCIGK